MLAIFWAILALAAVIFVLALVRKRIKQSRKKETAKNPIPLNGKIPLSVFLSALRDRERELSAILPHLRKQIHLLDSDITKLETAVALGDTKGLQELLRLQRTRGMLVAEHNKMINGLKRVQRKIKRYRKTV